MGNCVASEESNNFLPNSKDSCFDNRSPSSKVDNSHRNLLSPQNVNNKPNSNNDVANNSKTEKLSTNKYSNKIVIALYNYFANDEGDLSFRKVYSELHFQNLYQGETSRNTFRMLIASEHFSSLSADN
ncbi:hypothetical protein BLOT_011097 [Blomia tropicalis]|nr:hypothetical protein BLOT_011097 [Blomia tropicalis]